MAGNIKAGYPAVWLEKDLDLDHGRLSFDLLDDNLRERLTMTLALAIVGLSLVLENKDLLIFALSLDFARYLGTFDDRRTDLDISIVDDRQDLIEYDCFAFASSQLLDRDRGLCSGRRSVQRRLQRPYTACRPF